jgi:hypothetical protein
MTVTIRRTEYFPCWILLLLAAGTARAGETGQLDTSTPSSALVSPEQMASAVGQAHAALWSKFIDEHGLIHDYVAELPGPADCELGRPNAIGW